MAEGIAIENEPALSTGSSMPADLAESKIVKSENFTPAPISRIDALAFTIIGASTGVLVGLSASPVIASVISGVIASVSALIAGIGGVDQKIRIVRPWPLAWFALFLVLGSGGGIYLRAHNLLGVDPLQSEIEMWTSQGVDRPTVVRRIFAHEYPLVRGIDPFEDRDLAVEVSKWTTAGITDPATIATWLLEYAYPLDAAELPTRSAAPRVRDRSILDTVLKSADVEECDALHAARHRAGGDWQEAFRTVSVDRWRVLAVITDTVQLEEIHRRDLCPTE